MNRFFFVTILIPFFFCTGCSFLPLSEDVDWGDFLGQTDVYASKMILFKNNDGNLNLAVYYSLYEEDNTPQKIETNDLNIDIIKRPYIWQGFLSRSYDHGKTEEVYTYTEKDPNEIAWDKRFEILWARRIDKLSGQRMVYDDMGNPLFAVAIQESNNLDNRYFLQILAPEDGSLLDTYSVDLPEDVWGHWKFSDDLVYLINYLYKFDHGPDMGHICFFKLDSNSKRYLLTKRMKVSDFNNDNGKVQEFIKIDNNGIALISFETGTRRSFTNKQTIVCYDLLNQKILFEYSFHAIASIVDVAISQDRKYVALKVSGLGWYKTRIRLYKIKDMEKTLER